MSCNWIPLDPNEELCIVILPSSEFIITSSLNIFWLSISQPAILPPVNSTAEPVISPLPCTIKLFELINVPLLVGEPLIKILEAKAPPGLETSTLSLISNPPINPEEAVIDPSNLAPDAISIPLEDTAKVDPKCWKKG